MQIQYVIINFLILALILFLFARKTVISIFRTRRLRIEDELNKAEEIESAAPTAFAESSPEEAEFCVDDTEITYAKDAALEKISQINSFGDRECREIHREMLEKARNKLFEEMKTQVAQLFSKEPYISRVRMHESDMLDMILEKVRLTAGDMAYLRHHDVLYVTLTSAHSLHPDLVARVEAFVTKMLEEVNGKPSLWVLEDASLIGGLRLRIGDTVYDATVTEALYHFGKSLSHDPIPENNEIDGLLKEFTDKINIFHPKIYTYQLGRVITVSDGICWMDGLADIMYGEVIEFECGEKGMVLDIQQDRIGCVIFGKYEHIESGSRVRRVGRIATVPVGEAMLGRVVDAIGKPIDGEGYLSTAERRPIEFKAPAILDRAPVDKPLHTGIKAIDALVPIGRGQRELIIGDRQTGKTAIAIDTIINQKGKNTICIYVAIGQKETLISEIKERLEKHGALEYTIIVAATASGSAALQYIAPFSGTAMGEYFMYSGKDVLIIYDDLSKHAVAYRELSLLLHRPSGREAYPGDIFYLHSRLLERSAHLSKELGGGSMTALPIIETLAGDISAYIPTNVISITDGQIFLDSELFNEGQRPAVNVGLSVSRVGSAAQSRLMKQVAAKLRTKLAQYRELADFMQFGTDIDDTTKAALDSGSRLTEALKQGRYKPIPDYLQALLLFAVSEGYSGKIELNKMEDFEESLYVFFKEKHGELVEILATGAKMTDDTAELIKSALNEFLQTL